MNERTFTSIAAVIDFHRSHEDSDIEDLAIDLADIFTRENKRFNKASFLENCGFGEKF